MLKAILIGCIGGAISYMIISLLTQYFTWITFTAAICFGGFVSLLMWIAENGE